MWNFVFKIVQSQKVVFIRERLGGEMKIAILLILLVPILFWIVFIWTIFENAVERMKNYNLLGMLASLGFGILMAYGLYEFLLKIIDPG